MSIPSSRTLSVLFLQVSLLLTVTANGLTQQNITLLPKYVSVEVNKIAVFNCSYSCETTRTNSHATFWRIGDFRESRGFTHSRPKGFIRKTGLQVEVKDLSNCDANGNGHVIHQVRINASSVSKWNKTPIQCVALSIQQNNEPSIYSAFRLLFVNPAPQPKLAKAVTPTPTPILQSSSLPHPVICPSPVTVHITHTKVTTVTEERTVTTTVAVLPTTLPANSEQGINTPGSKQ